jgi:hypothetical protein
MRCTILAAGTLVASASMGCGGGGGESLDDVLRGLRNAALSKKTYNAISHADDLDATEKATVNAFCNVATQLADNGETVTEEEYFEAVKQEAEDELGVVGSAPLNAAVARWRAFYDFATISGGAANLYARACFR